MKLGDKVICCDMICTISKMRKINGKLILGLIDENGYGIITNQDNVTQLT